MSPHHLHRIAQIWCFARNLNQSKYLDTTLQDIDYKGAKLLLIYATLKSRSQPLIYLVGVSGSVSFQNYPECIGFKMSSLFLISTNQKNWLVIGVLKGYRSSLSMFHSRDVISGTTDDVIGYWWWCHTRTCCCLASISLEWQEIVSDSKSDRNSVVGW